MAKIRVIAESTELVHFAQSSLLKIQRRPRPFLRMLISKVLHYPSIMSAFNRSTYAIVGVGRTDVAKIWVIAESTDLCHFRPIAHC